jgi:hypothetical protein
MRECSRRSDCTCSIKGRKDAEPGAGAEIENDQHRPTQEEYRFRIGEQRHHPLGQDTQTFTDLVRSAQKDRGQRQARIGTVGIESEGQAEGLDRAAVVPVVARPAALGEEGGADLRGRAHSLALHEGEGGCHQGVGLLHGAALAQALILEPEVGEDLPRVHALSGDRQRHGRRAPGDGIVRLARSRLDPDHLGFGGSRMSHGRLAGVAGARRRVGVQGGASQPEQHQRDRTVAGAGHGGFHGRTSGGAGGVTVCGTLSIGPRRTASGDLR